MVLHYCKTCKQVHEVGQTCRKAGAIRRALPRRKRPPAAPTLILDSKFAMAGKRWPGLNNDRPFESKAAFERELKDKGLHHASPREMREGPPKSASARLAEIEKQLREGY